MTIQLLCEKCNSKFERTICDDCWERLLEDAKRSGYDLDKALNPDREEKEAKRS